MVLGKSCPRYTLLWQWQKGNVLLFDDAHELVSLESETNEGDGSDIINELINIMDNPFSKALVIISGRIEKRQRLERLYFEDYPVEEFPKMLSQQIAASDLPGATDVSQNAITSLFRKVPSPVRNMYNTALVEMFVQKAKENFAKDLQTQNGSGEAKQCTLKLEHLDVAKLITEELMRDDETMGGGVDAERIELMDDEEASEVVVESLAPLVADGGGVVDVGGDRDDGGDGGKDGKDSGGDTGENEPIVEFSASEEKAIGLEESNHNVDNLDKIMSEIGPAVEDKVEEIEIQGPAVENKVEKVDVEQWRSDICARWLDESSGLPIAEISINSSSSSEFALKWKQTGKNAIVHFQGDHVVMDWAGQKHTGQLSAVNGVKTLHWSDGDIWVRQSPVEVIV